MELNKLFNFLRQENSLNCMNMFIFILEKKLHLSFDIPSTKLPVT